MTDQSAQEPTMEEILASIRRIISEDDAPAAEASSEAETSAGPTAAPTAGDVPDAFQTAHQDEPEDVLELTDRYQEPAADAFDMAAAPLAQPEPTPLRSEPPPRTQPVASSGDLDIFDRAPEPPMTQPTPRASTVEAGDDGLLSAATASAAASSFGALSQRVAMPAAGTTLEDVIRDMLRPMLREWLDQHLPAIVEARVQAEVERVSRMGGR